ncbi:MAG: zinc-binding dehydrogenase, partial [Verrucomicrobia bacterium]|nr:zinc-binding dehydrogenase [Verrucomicrobiota bacterium]
LVGITAHLGLVNEARIREGKTIFVVGGSGGVGSMVIQISKILGARVIACAGNDEKLRVCRDLGADEVVNYKTQKIEPAIRGFAPEGVDYWWETRRDPDFDQVVSALAPRGRMILMAGRDARPPFPVGPFYVKNCSVHGFVMFMATAEEQRVCASDLNEWMSAGKLKPRIHKVLPLSEASAAHKLQEENTIGGAGTLCGKIVLKP